MKSVLFAIAATIVLFALAATADAAPCPCAGGQCAAVAATPRIPPLPTVVAVATHPVKAVVGVVHRVREAKPVRRLVCRVIGRRR